VDWSHESLWLKTRLYAKRAADEPREGPLFGLWSAMTLELLARSALAFVHPALLADPRGDDVLYSVGFPSSKAPRSIAAHTVVSRCQAVVKGFTEAEAKFCNEVMGRRNAELHSGALAFEGLRPEAWLADYYRVCDLLLRAQGKTLGRLFGGDEARAARRMIAAAAADIRKRVLDSISAHRTQFELLTDDEKTERRRALGMLVLRLPPNALRVLCPACGSYDYVEGKAVRPTRHRLDGDQVVIETVALPVRFECRTCGLRLLGHGALHAAGMGGQYTHREEWDAFEYYDTGDAPAEYYEDEYGND